MSTINFVLTKAGSLLANTRDVFKKKWYPNSEMKIGLRFIRRVVLSFFKLFYGVICIPIRISIVAKNIA